MNAIRLEATTLSLIKNTVQATRKQAVGNARIATGLRVSNALDDASNFAIAQGMRGQIRGQTAVMQGISNTQGLLKTAMAGARAIGEILAEMRSKAIAASNPSITNAQKDSLTDQLRDLTLQIDQIAANAGFNGKNLLAETRSDLSSSTFDVSSQISTTKPSLGAAACLMRQGELAEAATRLDSVLDHTPIHNQTLTFRSILHQLAGEKDKASRITNFDQDISIALLPIPEEFSDSSHFNSALASALMNNPTLSTDPHAKSTRGGKQSGELAIFDNPVVTRFVTTLDNFLREYLISLKLRPDHPHYKTIPKHYGLDCWSTILRSEGYQLPHIHTSAWLSGVYYVQLPPEINNRDKSHSGWIEFGGSGFNLPKHSGSLRLIAPKVGNLILFPSYFLHRTVPFHSKRPRISIAFDIVPKV